MRRARRGQTWQDLRCVFGDYVARWNASVPAPAQAFRYGTVVEGGREFDWWGCRCPAPDGRSITAGFHGDEKAGPLTLLEHAAGDRRLRGRARRRPAHLSLHQPVGLRGAHPVQHLGRASQQRLPPLRDRPGRLARRAPRRRAVLPIVPAVDGLPKETAALARELDRAPLPAASLDLHQDNFIHGSLFYAYVFGDLATYRPLMARAGSLVPVLRSSIVDSGHEPGSDVRADAEGFIDLPRRQHHRPVSPGRRPLTSRRSRPPPRRPPRWPTRST